MAQIVISTTEVSTVSSNFNTKRGEMEAMISQANSLRSQLESNWKGIRANKFQTDYASMAPALKQAEATLQRVSEILKTAAQDFERADTAG